MASPDAGAAPGTPKSEFLQSVRDTLGRSAGPPLERYHRLEESLADLEQRAAELRSRLRENEGQLLDRFADMAAKGGWNVYRSPGVEDAVGYIETLARRLNVQRAVRSGQPVFDGIPVDAAFSNNGATITTMVHGDTATRQSLRKEVRQAGLGLTGADYALAETGSIVILPRRGLSRLVSLVPPVHVALVRPEELLEGLDDLFLLRRLEYYRNGGEMGSYLNFITGPSRTADIEMTIVQGVHGPKEVHLVLLG